MASKKPFETTITVTFKVKHTDGPRPVDLGDLHAKMEEEWNGLEMEFQGDDSKDEETTVELEVEGFTEAGAASAA